MPPFVLWFIVAITAGFILVVGGAVAAAVTLHVERVIYRAVNGFFSVIGLLAGVVIVIHPAGITQDLVSWFSLLMMLCLGMVALLPSLVAGTTSADLIKRAIAEAQIPTPLRSVSDVAPAAPVPPPPATPEPPASAAK